MRMRNGHSRVKPRISIAPPVVSGKTALDDSSTPPAGGGATEREGNGGEKGGKHEKSQKRSIVMLLLRDARMAPVTDRKIVNRCGVHCDIVVGVRRDVAESATRPSAAMKTRQRRKAEKTRKDGKQKAAAVVRNQAA